MKIKFNSIFDTMKTQFLFTTELKPMGSQFRENLHLQKQTN